MQAVPRNRRSVYKMRPIIDSVVDHGSFFEMGANFGRSIITGLARIDGHPVLLLASDPYHYGGAWSADTCQKVVRFIDLAETFHLPVVYLMDCPGFMIGLEAERSATIRHGVRAMAAHEPDHRALVHGDRAQRLRRGRRGAQALQPPVAALRLAVGLLGQRCRWKAASRPPTAPTSRQPTTPRPSC